MITISLVDLPAVEADFVAFSKEEEAIKFAVENEEQRMVKGVVMRASHPIYRISNGYEYYIQYSKETIKQMAQKYLADGLQNRVDLMHDGEMVSGVEMVELFIKDVENGVNPKGFEEIEDGSLFATFHVENEDIWNSIKEGVYKGFSLEGFFNVVPDEAKFNKQEKKNTFKMKLDKLKTMLKAMLQAFGEISTSKGVLVYDGDEDIKVGDVVHGVDEEGNEINVEDGEYATEDKRVIVVVDGKVSEIKAVEEDKPTEEEEKPVEEEEKPIDEPKEDETEEPKPEETEEPKEDETEEPKEDEKDLKIKELENKIAELEKVIEEKDNRIKELEDAPAAKSAEEEFSAIKDDNSKTSQLRKRGYRF